MNRKHIHPCAHPSKKGRLYRVLTNYFIGQKYRRIILLVTKLDHVADFIIRGQPLQTVRTAFERKCEHIVSLLFCNNKNSNFAISFKQKGTIGQISPSTLHTCDLYFFNCDLTVVLCVQKKNTNSTIRTVYFLCFLVFFIKKKKL